jgi:hypothetical protein
MKHRICTAAKVPANGNSGSSKSAIRPHFLGASRVKARRGISVREVDFFCLPGRGDKSMRCLSGRLVTVGVSPDAAV